MKTYRKTEERNGYTIITEITENGWKQWTEWERGILKEPYSRTWSEMGWKNLDEFLKNRGERFTQIAA